MKEIIAEPVIAKKGPYEVEVEAGKTYYWCSCGKSATQPFCDGTHSESGFQPVPFTPEVSDTIFFCGCKHTKAPPFCDGTDKEL